MPRAEYKFNVSPVPHNDSSAKGTDNGKLSKIVKGCTVLSNCEARIMYMKMIERMNAQINSVNVLSSSRARPETVVVYALGRFISRTAPRNASIRSASAKPGATDA